MNIPPSYLTGPPIQKRIICHWTVTGYEPDSVSLDSYHLVIGYNKSKGVATLHQGYRDISQRAPHTYGFNSAIGVSVACMGGYVGPNNVGPYPLLKEQWDMLVDVVAGLCREYDIEPIPSKVLQHGEVTNVLGVDQWGKWDIGLVPHLKLDTPEEVGAALRAAVREALETEEYVPVQVHFGPALTLEGMLNDGSAMVPLRFAIEGLKAAGLAGMCEVVEVNKNKATVVVEKGVLHVALYIDPSGTGWVPLRALTQLLGLDIKTGEWTAKSRNLHVIEG